MSTPTETEKLVRMGMYLLTGIVMGMFLLMTTCTIHSNTYDADRTKAEALRMKQVVALEERKTTAKIAIAEKEAETKKTQLETLERLVDKGLNPVAIRCAIGGWKTQAEGHICERTSGQK